MRRRKTPNEVAFDECVRAIGGICLDDVLPPDPHVKNADYLFESENVIAELKRLKSDSMEEPSVKQKIQDLYEAWIRKGLIIPPKALGKLSFNIRDLPKPCAVEVLGVLKKRLDDSYVKGANRQIKSTKELLARPDAMGLLLLMNEGNLSFDPSVILNLLFHVFNGGSRSAINQVVVFTFDIRSDLPVNERGGFYWIQPSIGNRLDVPLPLLRRLSHQWGLALKAKHPEVTESWVISGPSPEWVEAVKHVRHGI